MENFPCEMKKIRLEIFKSFICITYQFIVAHSCGSWTFTSRETGWMGLGVKIFFGLGIALITLSIYPTVLYDNFNKSIRVL